MKILVLNGSPRPNGNTAALVSAFVEGAKENGHEVTVVPVCQKKIAGCLACEYCHTKGEGRCIQQDDMQEVYPVLAEAEMIVLASPVYYHSFTGQFIFQMGHLVAVPDFCLAGIHLRAVPPVVFPQLLLIVVNHALGKLDAVFIAVHIDKGMPVTAQRSVQTHDQYDCGKQNRYQNHHDIG